MRYLFIFVMACCFIIMTTAWAAEETEPSTTARPVLNQPFGFADSNNDGVNDLFRDADGDGIDDVSKRIYPRTFHFQDTDEDGINDLFRDVNGDGINDMYEPNSLNGKGEVFVLDADNDGRNDVTGLRITAPDNFFPLLRSIRATSDFFIDDDGDGMDDRRLLHGSSRGGRGSGGRGGGSGRGGGGGAGRPGGGLPPITSSSSHGQKNQPSEQFFFSWGRETRFGKLCRRATIESIQGKAVKIEIHQPEKKMGTGFLVELEVETGKIPAYIGPQWYLVNQGVALETGQSLQIQGYRVTFEKKPAIIVTAITFDSGKTLRLADKDGFFF